MLDLISLCESEQVISPVSENQKFQGFYSHIFQGNSHRGTANTQADYLNISCSNWELNQEMFQEITLKWGVPGVDFFCIQSKLEASNLLLTRK